MTRVRPAGAFGLLASGLVVLSSLAGCASEESVGSAAAPVVYGTDDRVDVYESTNALFEGVARDAIVALVTPAYLTDEGDGTFTPDPFSLANYIAALAQSDPGDDLPDGEQLCAGERFASQPTIGACSGTLIDDDLVLTAGHCTDGLTCPDFRFVFDYFYSAEGVLETIDTDDVYDCAEVLVQRLDGGGAGQDYAIVRLDRPVVGRTPVPVDVSYSVTTGDPVVVVGFPTGIPAKIDEGGVVTADRAGSLDYFTATTDTFGGNSGSGVFDPEGTLVGILVRGATDYVSNGSCIEVNVVDVGAGFDGGEDITYATNAIEALCEVVANGETSLCEDGQPIGGTGGGTGGGTAMAGGGGGGGSGSGGGDCAASPGESSPVALASILVAAGIVAVRRRRR